MKGGGEGRVTMRGEIFGVNYREGSIEKEQGGNIIMVAKLRGNKVV